MKDNLLSRMILPLALLILSFSTATNCLAGEYEIYYFKQPVPLRLNASQIAILTNSDSKELKKTLSRFDAVAGQPVTDHPVKGWQLANVRRNGIARNQLKNTVDQIGKGAQLDFVTPVFFDEFGGPFFPTRDILVRFNPQVDVVRQNEILNAANLGVLLDRDWGSLKGAYRIRSHSRNGLDVLEQANTLARMPEVRWAEPDMIFTGRGSGEHIPNDPLFPACWGLHNTGQQGSCQSTPGIPDMDMDAPEVWDITLGSPDILVLIMDTGAQQDHPDLNQVAGQDFTTDIGDGGPVNACDNHGTPVAGCVSARIDNGVGTVGVAPECRSASARCFISSLSCSGSWNGSYSWGVDALVWAESLGVRVTNNSNYYGGTSAALADKYAQTRQDGMVHFSSAGNFSSTVISYPANLPDVNAVAALAPDGLLASFSNYGVGLAFSSPGSQVSTTDRTGTNGWTNGDYTCANGTSFASPYAAGVAALILSVNPSLSAFDVEQIMQDCSVDLGTPGYDTTFGWGFVNAYSSVLKAAQTITVAPTALTPTKGIVVDGSTDELLQSDNLDFQMQRDTSNIASVTEFEILGTSSVSNPTQIVFTVEGSVFARTDVNLTISLFDYLNSEWEIVYEGDASRFSDSTAIVSPTAELNRFVAGNGNVEARISYRSTNARQNFSANTDHVFWTITGF